MTYDQSFKCSYCNRALVIDDGIAQSDKRCVDGEIGWACPVHGVEYGEMTTPYTLLGPI